MSSSINNVRLMGNLGRVPWWSKSPSGASVCHVVLATDDVEEDWLTGQERKVTHWHRVVLTGELADSMRKRISKGDALLVEGRMQTRKCGRNGEAEYVMEVLATSAVLYAKPRHAAQIEHHDSPRLTDPVIVDWIAEYDAADAREKVANLPKTPTSRAGRSADQRLPSNGRNPQPRTGYKRASTARSYRAQ